MREWLREGWVGNQSQLCRLRRVELREGAAKGCEIIEVATAGGLSLDILPDTGLDRTCEFERPIDGEEERVFFHLMKRDFHAALRNPELGMEASVSWSGGTLPILAEWRSIASGEYVLGLEPANCYIMGRGAEREHGTLRTLPAFETVRHTVEFQFSKMEDC